MQKKSDEKIIERSPVIVVMGHIDHGKSTLLDYIRKTNVVESEAGGITQHISAYEVSHKDEHGVEKKITFLDTPGHAAFSKMRTRGAQIADIAILIVSAEDGVKPQTIEAWKTIEESKIPVIVAINKIDKPGANVEKTKSELAENEIYLENYGGSIPFAEISAKTGTGIENLLSLINIMADLEGFTGDASECASGLVIEANLDPKRGIQATLIIKNGTLTKGMTVAVGNALCSTRIIENFKGAQISEASFSSPIRLVGFDTMPKIGGEFKSFKKKEEALEYSKSLTIAPKKDATKHIISAKKVIPVVLKADVSGSIEAIEKEIEKITNPNAEFKIISKGEGPIGEKDIKSISVGEEALVIGFNVKADANAIELAERRGISISFFDIIYKMTEWLEEEMEKRRPRMESVETTGRAKILKAFSRTKERQIIGGKVVEGHLTIHGIVKIIRREFEIGRGKIVNLEKGKVKTSEVLEGEEFGMMVESKVEIVSGDIIESFAIIQK
jgi:translation initiation factor IF-2